MGLLQEKISPGPAKQAKGVMSIVGTERSDNGALFVTLRNDVGDDFLVPIADLMPMFEHLFGSRYIVLQQKRYYGREVYEPRNRT